MGSVFRYVADEAVFACGGDSCHHCERDDVPVYRYDGEIIDPARARNPTLAAEEPDVSELCADCILGGNVCKPDWRLNALMPVIRRWATDPARVVEEFHHTPDIPLFLQRDDWPLCCGGWCEFVGVPASRDESRQVPHAFRYWERGPAEWAFQCELLPDSQLEVCLFRCGACGGGCFVWQPT